MSQRIRDIGINPWYALAGLVAFTVVDQFILANIPSLVVQEIGGLTTTKVSGLFNLVVFLILVGVPAGFAGEPGPETSRTSQDEADSGPSWADAVVLPRAGADAPRNVIKPRMAPAASSRGAPRAGFGVRDGVQRR